MNYGELINEIINLGFEEANAYGEQPDVFNFAITRACRLIATLVQAPVGKIDLNLKDIGTTTTMIYVGSGNRTIVINGEVVNVSDGNIAVYNDTAYVFIGGAWQLPGKYDLEILSKDEYNNVRFDSVDRIVRNTDSGIETFLDYDIEQYKILVLDPSLRDNLTVFYKERIVPVTNQTVPSYEIQVVYPCEPLVALLAAHYVWLDDDERKAVMYWNEFDQLRQEIEAKAFRLKARVVGGYPWLK